MQPFVQMVIKLEIEYRLFHVDFRIMELVVNSFILQFDVIPRKESNISSIIMSLNIHRLLTSRGFRDAAAVSP